LRWPGARKWAHHESPYPFGTFFAARHSCTFDPQLDYFHNMRTDGMLTVIGTVVLMIVATFQRQLK
jgi:hypothetical protein